MECYVWDINSSVKRDSLGTLAEFISRGSLNRIYLNAMPITFFNNTLSLSLVLLVALSAFCSLLCFSFFCPLDTHKKPIWSIVFPCGTKHQGQFCLCISEGTGRQYGAWCQRDIVCTVQGEIRSSKFGIWRMSGRPDVLNFWRDIWVRWVISSLYRKSAFNWDLQN